MSHERARMDLAGQGLMRPSGQKVRGFVSMLTVACAVAMLAGCAAVGLGGDKSVETFDLSAPEGIKTSRATGAQILVPEPVALKSLDTERIVVRPKPGEINYFGGAQWSDRLPRLIQNRLVQTFENSGRVRAGRPGQGLKIDYQVVTDLRAFEYDTASGQARVEISVKLMNDRDGRVVASEVFTGTGPVAGDSAAATAAALSNALDGQLQAIVAWVVKRI